MAYIASLEALASSMQSQTYEIHELGRASGFVVVSHLVYYENTTGAADFMATSLLEAAFVEVLREYPLLAGTMHECKHGRFKVVVDKDNLNLPEFKETQCETDFGVLKAANYAPSELPEGAATMGRTTDHSRKSPAKLARVHIMRYRDNSGVAIFVGISHALVDGYAYNLVMRRWAEICKHLAGSGSLDAKPGRPLSHGCELMDDFMQQLAPPAGAFIRHKFIPGGLVSKLLSGRSMKTQVRLIRKMCESGEFTSHFYFIAQDTIDEMRGAIKEVVPAEQPVSSNDVITALVNVAMAQSLEAAAIRDPQSGVLQRVWAALFGAQKPQPKVFVHMGAADIRPRLKIPAADDYCGSAVMRYAAHVPLDALQGPVTPKMLAIAATSARKGTDSVDRGYMYTYSSTIAEEPDCVMRPFIYGGQPPARLIITSHARIGHYRSDFGWGVPVWANVIEDTGTALCYVYPAPPTRNGLVVHMMLPKDIQDRMRQLPFWKENVEFIR
ncbi:hypothetical protein LPJ61_006045 [Coemansia biformis]|uniref:Uncharacterized protein n=1 Tax=Coemansia biformis TaxID=1286918 RepID=A0A9W7XZU1_9FUNG|nr:hypothetical protein LPJ61_006045 [Coemansia biformis]